MKSLTKETRFVLIDAFNSTSRYLDDLLNIDNIHFEHMVHRIYPAELQLNKANASDTEAAFLDLNLSIHNDIVSTKIYDKRDDFNFDIVNFQFLDDDIPQRPQVIEDEKHILLHCTLYEQYRKQLYGSVNELCPSFKDLENGDQLNYLLNSDGPIEKAVARFFYLANLMHSSVNMN